jgi:hypothetical protein
MKTDLNIKYDVFVSSPMAALIDKQYQADRKNVGKIVAFLRNCYKKSSVFWRLNQLNLLTISSRLMFLLNAISRQSSHASTLY